MSPNLSDTRQSAGDKAIARFAESMIQRMEEMKSESWKKGWLPAVPGGGVPMNISGRPYSGSNPFMLWLMSAGAGYKAPVFLTFNQANKLDVRIRKGAVAHLFSPDMGACIGECPHPLHLHGQVRFAQLHDATDRIDVPLCYRAGNMRLYACVIYTILRIL